MYWILRGHASECGNIPVLSELVDLSGISLRAEFAFVHNFNSLFQFFFFTIYIVLKDMEVERIMESFFFPPRSGKRHNV